MLQMFSNRRRSAVKRLMVKLAEPGKTWSRWITPSCWARNSACRTALSLSAISKTSTGIMIVLYICNPPCSFASISTYYMRILCHSGRKTVSRAGAKRKKGKRRENSRKRMCGHPLNKARNASGSGISGGIRQRLPAGTIAPALPVRRCAARQLPVNGAADFQAQQRGAHRREDGELAGAVGHL